MDGWGSAPPSPGNAITLANPITLNSLWASYPHTLLSASGESVGIPRGEPGNTEAGHLNLGAGRIVYQDLPRINLAIAEGSFFKNEVFLEAIAHARTYNSNLHLMGLVGAGGVHSNVEHLYGLLRLAREQQFTRVYLHVFTDGRDSPPSAALTYIQQLEKVVATEQVGTIATVMGRYWAMDRDFRWERTERAYLVLTKGQGKRATSVQEAIESSYKEKKTDEFIEPTLITDESGNPHSLIKDNDAIIFFNYRIDRPRQLTKAFVLPDFEERAQKEWDFDPYMVKYYQKHNVEIPQRPVFQRGPLLQNLYFVTMTQYGKLLPVHVAFPPETVELPLGRVLSERGVRQLRMAESEKERFVTFYFNGQQELPFAGEDRIIIPSPAVATYDLKPEMAAREITAAFLENLRVNPQSYGFTLINFANADMVGHTGNLAAGIVACKTVDSCVGEIVNVVEELGGAVLLTGDHGNAEEMINPITGQPRTEHSDNSVPFIIISKQFVTQPRTLPAGILADVAPTVLYLLGIDKPLVMTGRNLLS